MAITREQLVDRLEGELAALSDPAIESRMRAILIQPVLIRCAWDYGSPGETYPCWRVAEEPVRQVGIVYCEQGFGPRTPWGLVWLRDAVPSMGQDSAWFLSFREAAADILGIPSASFGID